MHTHKAIQNNNSDVGFSSIRCQTSASGIVNSAWLGDAALRPINWLILVGSVNFHSNWDTYPIGSMYGIYANIGGILMVNVTIYSIQGFYGL